MTKKFLTGLIMLIAITGCLKKYDSTSQQQCTYDPCALKASDAEIQNVKKYLDSIGVTATQHCSGLFYKVDDAGLGSTPSACSYITVRYRGSLTNGTVFDETPSGQYYSNNLSGLIRGWVNGLPFIKAGGKIHLYIPPSLGYGSSSTASIPANSILIFEVDLIAVQ
jgi:FKBP-type peptidyl-prolyl cis-trans isomerase FkpA